MLGTEAVATRTGVGEQTAFPWSWLLPPIVLCGLLLRLAAADRLPGHLDEGNTLLGIHAVAERGWPLLPSGVLYLHGATVSYLLAPLARLGLADYTDLFPLRVFSALCWALAVYLTDRLARIVTGSVRAAAVGAVGLLLAHAAGALRTLGIWATDEADSGLAPALAYVAAHREPGEWAVVDSPPEAYLVLGGGDDVRVIGRVRTQPGPAGVAVDDRVGWPVLADTAERCTVLAAQPGTWVVQGHRLEIPRQMTGVLDGAGDEVLRTSDDFRVLRTRPPAAWDATAARRCRPG